MELLVVVHRYFVACLVGVWQRNFELVPSRPHGTHTTDSELRCQTPTKHTTKYL
jgi:hypothetical protein